MTKKKAKKAAAPDRALIRHCVTFAQAVAAGYAGFAADPDGNSAHAAPAGNPYTQRADEALIAIARLHAETTEGLEAKARIVPFILKNSDGTWSELQEAFFESFGRDVKEFWARRAGRIAAAETARAA